ncbi:MAG: (deoxy)nucleoside triphosphate pyrophosphohydrolase [Proteobacteria bacterium]|nr:(deoxy)nucleoside triphosphate pyrophosphohydrolase [Pseudomonadota bacterium]
MANEHISVSCAIIERNGLVLAAQRSTAMSLPLKWEFPGGKIREGESPEDGIRREILEELDVTIKILKALPPSTYTYPTITVTLHPFICSIFDGEIKLHEHEAVAWLPSEELDTLDWAEADLPVLATYCQIMGE